MEDDGLGSCSYMNAAAGHAVSGSVQALLGDASAGWSFQALMRDAAAGLLECRDTQQHSELLGLTGNYSQTNTQSQFEGSFQGDDGYVGGEESEADGFGEISDSEPDEEDNVNGNSDAYCEPDEEDLAETELNVNGNSDAYREAYEASKTESNVSEKISHTEEVAGEDSDDEEEMTVDVDLSQEIYIDAAQAGVPYKKRKRHPRNVHRPNCRAPRMMSTMERALRSSSTRKTEHIFEPILGLVFDSREEAREFYNLYSWEVGFGVKLNNSRTGTKKNKIDGDEEYRSMQEIVCQRSGYDPRVKSKTKRCGCPAKIQLLRTDDYGWYISSFVKNHNHPLSVTCGQKREWNSHKMIDQSTKDTIKYLRQNNVSLTRIHCILSSMFGSMGDVPWTKRSLRTVCDQITRDQMGDDIRKTMEIFKEMHAEDPGFQFSVDPSRKGRIKTLMWCSGRSRDQYACFGDVVTFDTTYCTNIYKMPFGLFVGVNNHFQTTIFAGVLMTREKTNSFEWVFREFLRLMGGKAPKTILTDQCKAMTTAIGIVMPDTYHLWCKWHVMKKIRESLGPLYTKNRKFRDDFWLVVNGMLTEDEFERGWNYLVTNYNLHNSGFMIRTYECRHKWAKPWAKDKYCARMSSTQRSESANFMLKRFVPRNSSMNHFVSQYNRLLFDRDREEDIAEDKTKQLVVVHERLWAVERHALSIYTKAAFELFRKEVDKASNYILTARDGNVFTISHDNPAKRKAWARVHFKVEMLDNGAKFVCQCGLYEHFGMLCCHALRLMLKLDIGFIPEAHVMKRWTRDARDIIPENMSVFKKDHSVKHSFTFRRRMLQLKNAELVRMGDMDMELFDIVFGYMKVAEKQCKEVIAARERKALAVTATQQIEESDEYDADDDNIAVHSDGEALRGNKYGASGSSAGLSDTEIIKLKAPLVVRKHGRPRTRRYKGSTDAFRKKKPDMKLKDGPVSGRATMSVGTSIDLLTTSGNAGIEKEYVPVWLDMTLGDNLVAEQDADEQGKGQSTQANSAKGLGPQKGGCTPGLPRQTICCSKCGNPGHNKNKCVVAYVPKAPKKPRVTKCGKCGMTGHKGSQCYSLEISPTTAADYI